MSKKDSAPSKEAARAVLWRQGNLDYKLHAGQKDMKEKFMASSGKKFVINSSRQIGKSFFLCVLANEFALRNPGSQIKYAAPTKEMVKNIITPHFDTIIKDAPDDCRPTWRAQESRYLYPNGSMVNIAGTEAGNIERLRGTKADLGIIDEAASMSDLKYVLSDVLMPMTLTTNGRIIVASTPPIVPRHQFEAYAIEAKKNGNYVHKTIHDNPMVTFKQMQEFLEECGGADSATWRREYLAEFVYDATLLVCPEFTPDKQAQIIKDLDRPKYFDSYVSLDPGFVDLTVALFGYYDFMTSRIVFEDEVVLDKIRTDILADCIKEKERTLWGDKKPYFRVSDAEPILLRDLDELHGLRFVTTDRDNKLASINELRMLIQSGGIVISPKCRTLISHLESAIWDSKKDKFSRVKGFGHFDAIDAAIYFIRNIRKHHNPFPAESKAGPNMHVAWEESAKSGTAKVFERIFKPRKFSA